MGGSRREASKGTMVIFHSWYCYANDVTCWRFVKRMEAQDGEVSTKVDAVVFDECVIINVNQASKNCAGDCVYQMMLQKKLNDERQPTLDGWCLVLPDAQFQDSAPWEGRDSILKDWVPGPEPFGGPDTHDWLAWPGWGRLINQGRPRGARRTRLWSRSSRSTCFFWLFIYPEGYCTKLLICYIPLDSVLPLA